MNFSSITSKTWLIPSGCSFPITSNPGLLSLTGKAMIAHSERDDISGFENKNDEELVKKIFQELNFNIQKQSYEEMY
ncbi:unnamed protein product [Rhizophagus irregularis]|nr:unnamed protein product [Rhizophagus irregularis]